MQSIDLFLNLGPLQADGTYTIVSHWEDLRDVQRSFTLGKARFDFDALGDETNDLARYGTLLSDAVFADARVRDDFRRAREAAGKLQADLRMRIAIDASVPELHRLRWETLLDPDPPRDALATNARILFSRFLASDRDWWTGRPQARQELAALAVVAAPADLDPKRFAPIDAGAWANLIAESLGEEIPIRWLGAKDGLPATLDGIGEALRKSRSDILVLVAHGMLDTDGAPWLWLQGGAAGAGGAGGGAARVSGLDLIERIKGLETPPRLVVLCSCQSAGAGGARGAADWAVLAALGPRLAEVGVPAVVAMQGLVPMKMARDFLETFFEEIRIDGQVDRAMSVARARVQERPEHWMPTLFLRLKSGNIRWYTRGFMVKGAFELWPGLIEDIANARCTPLLGPGMCERLSGTNRELARRWSSDPELKYPMAGLHGADLQQVAQYLAVTRGPNLPRDGLKRHLVEEFIKRFGAATEPFRTMYKKQPLQPITEKLLQGIMTKAWESKVGPDFSTSRDAHAILARLPFPVYLTANPDGLMFEALNRAKSLDGPPKRPCWVEFPWCKPAVERAVIEGRAADAPTYQPTEAEPLVGYLLGSFRAWDCVPVTEDDYFEYLLRFNENRPKLHDEVQRALGSTSLLFLGFQLDDWSFRVLLHALRTFNNDSVLQNRVRVAVQINPDEEQVRDPSGAHRFVDEFFQRKSIFVYWGSTEDFLGELWEQWDALAGAGVSG